MSDSFGNNPFASLSSEGLPAGPEFIPVPIAKVKSRGRVDIIRQKAGRGGKTVTVVTNFTGIGLPEKEKLRQGNAKKVRHGRNGQGRANRDSGG